MSADCLKASFKCLHEAFIKIPSCQFNRTTMKTKGTHSGIFKIERCSSWISIFPVLCYQSVALIVSAKGDFECVHWTYITRVILISKADTIWGLDGWAGFDKKTRSREFYETFALRTKSFKNLRLKLSDKTAKWADWSRFFQSRKFPNWTKAWNWSIQSSSLSEKSKASYSYDNKKSLS